MSGAADGSIIPTIITSHITNSARNAPAPQVRMSGTPTIAGIDIFTASAGNGIIDAIRTR
jgi:hypothetical protein